MSKKRRGLKKCIDYVNIKTFEVQLSGIMSIITIGVLIYCDIFSDFYLFQETIQNILSCIIGAYVGALGLLLSGIAFISSLFTHDFIDAINQGLKMLYEKEGNKKKTQISGREAVDEIMESFYFISLHVGIMICIYTLVYIVLSSEKELVPMPIFWSILVILIYSFYFTVFYIVALIYNCIRLNSIKNKFQDTYYKGFYDKANEVRIDMLIATVLETYEGDKEKLLIDTLKNFVQSEYTEEKTKEELMDYFAKRYSRK